MKITTTPHDDNNGLTIEIRGITGLAPHVIAAHVADAAEEAATVLLVEPAPDGRP